MPQPAPVVEKQAAAGDGNEVYKFSIQRIKKKINDFILNNYHDLFQPPSKEAGGSPTKSKAVAVEYQQLEVTRDEFVKHPKILQKASDELQFCDEEGHAPVEVLKDCLSELETKGFVTHSSGGRYTVQIRDQKQKLHVFISKMLQ